MQPTSPVTIVIADDHPVFAEGLKQLLDTVPDFAVVGLAANGREALDMAQALHPDILILDLHMPALSGLDVLRELSQASSPVRCLLLTASMDEAQRLAALELGARGLILKESTTAEVIRAIRAVLAGELWVGRSIVADLVEGLRRARAGIGTPRHFGLTARQVDIIREVLGGSTNRDIATRLGIREDTVKQHLTSIYDKCGVSNRVELALFAVNHRLVA